MPEHNHGFPTAPRVTENLGEGDYLLEGMRFNMGGVCGADAGNQFRAVRAIPLHLSLSCNRACVEIFMVGAASGCTFPGHRRRTDLNRSDWRRVHRRYFSRPVCRHWRRKRPLAPR